MMRARFLVAMGVLVVVGCSGNPPRAGADTSPYRLHIQGHLGCGLRALEIEVPWDSDKSGSPFNFTADASDDIDLDRLRWAWAALQKLPEGRTVTFHTGSETIRASSWAGFLVLEPRHLDRDDHHSRIKIPDYIVNAILDHDGRLTDRDLERLVRERGRVTLVKINSDQGGASVWMERAGEPGD
ncbi:MAG: hypothetical protein E6K72_12810 [Candidatus Eisenbacteria bacterium]|uniref:Uncharacterized protein n=1 Tax=Eiseniibacteriota bacterium TaxID=2212470 RepID=A0A538SBH2_UNCEI|nr:MAG: hypothetical protein E6K72_12810 [Candidatus Eisenbacteria bacterium]